MIIPSANRLSAVSTYYFARKLAQIDSLNNDGGLPVINLGIGSPDLSPASEVVNTLITVSQQKDAHKYQPYKGIGVLRDAFSHWYQAHFGISIKGSDEILPLIGSKEGVMHISMAFINPGDEVLVPDPGYPSYSMCTLLAGGIPVAMPLVKSLGWKPDLDALRKKDLSKVKMMWINYPNMPTGATADPEFFEELVGFATEHQILICHDNPYVFLLNDHPISIFNAPGAKDCAVELISLSKCYNMAGWRVGAVAGKKPYIDAIMTYRSNMDSGMFRPVQEAAVTALGLGKDWIRSLNAVYLKRREIACSLYSQLDLEFDRDGAGLFLWGRIKGGYSSAEAYSEYLLNTHRVFITPGHIFGTNGEHYLRASLCSPEEDFIEAINRIGKSVENIYDSMAIKTNGE
jgi:LL-diaminopimelate aminotransferase